MSIFFFCSSHLQHRFDSKDVETGSHDAGRRFAEGQTVVVDLVDLL